MRFFLKSPDQRGHIDPPVAHLLRHLPLADKIQDADVVIVPITRIDQFRFDQSLYGVVKPWVLVDFGEWLWDWDQKQSYIWGQDALHHPWYQQNDAWSLFDRFVCEHPPKMIWHRELLKQHVTPTVQPIEWLCYHTPERPQSKDEFYGRPMEWLHSWGRSHEARVLFHAKTFEYSSHLGYDAVGSWDHLDEYVKRQMKFAAAIHVPDTKRVDISTVLHWQRQAKVSMSFNGCGVCCFRHAESPVNSIMAIQANGKAWTYPWIDGENCLEMDFGVGSECLTREFANRGDVYMDQLDNFLQRDDLHEVYARGLENCARYRPFQFFHNHFIPTIARFL